MSESKLLGDMYYIMDNCQNYYRLDAEGQLIVASTKDQAGVFSSFEVKEKIGTGKKAAFYNVISVEGTKGISLEILDGVAETVNTSSIEYDITKVDWLGYMRHFCYLTSSATNHLQMLNKMQSDVDLEICDILHYIELYDIREDEETRLVELLKDARNRRREIKDEIEDVKHFQESIGNNANLVKVQKAIKQLETLNKRNYAPRRLQELFKGGVKLKEAEKQMQGMQIEQRTERLEENSRVVQMSEIRRDTIFDTKKMDWVEFAKYQVEFFKNAEQHIHNLQLDLNDIDVAIEDTLFQIENANFNAVQGYMVFKKLRDLRTERKEKLKELEAVSILAEPFNCDAMLEQYEESLQAIEEIMTEQQTAQQIASMEVV